MKLILELDTASQNDMAMLAKLNTILPSPLGGATAAPAPQPAPAPAPAPQMPPQATYPQQPAPAPAPAPQMPPIPQSLDRQPAPAPQMQPMPQQPAPQMPQQAGEITQAMLAQTVQEYAKRNSPKATKAKFAEYGFTKVGDIPPERFAEMHAVFSQ